MSGKDGLNITIRINNRVAGKYYVPVREPRIQAKITGIRAPEELKPGETGVVTIVVSDKGSEPSHYNAIICISGGHGEEECRIMTLEKDSTISTRFIVGAGSYSIVLKGPNGKLFDEKRFIIREAPLEVVVDLEESRISYPDGGIIVFHVYEEGHVALRDVEALLESPLGLNYVVEKRSDSDGRGFYLIFNIEGIGKYAEKLPIKLSVTIWDALGRKHLPRILEYEVEMNVSEKYLERIRREIEEYIYASRASLKDKDYPDALLNSVKAVISCRKYSQFLDCSEYEEFLRNIPFQLSLLQAYAALSDALEEASDRGSDIEVKILEDMKKNYEDKLVALRRILGEYLEKATQLFGERKLNDTFRILDEAGKQCLDAGYKQEYSHLLGECRRIYGLLEIVESYKRLLASDIRVEVPRTSRMKSFKIEVIARNSLDKEVDGVFIDFSPAKYYLELPSDRIILPPLYPGMEISSEVRVKSLFTGTIVVPYRVCLGDLCVDKKATISIGRRIGGGGEEHRHVSDASILIGKSVTGLEQLGINPRIPSRLSREIVFEDYRCSHILGSGGFSVTLLCSRQGVNVVLKIPPEAYHILLSGNRVDRVTLGIDDRLLKAFDREARVLHELKHPNIVKLLKYSLEPFPHLVFEYCEIGDLRRVMMSVPRLKPRLALEVMIPITSAVAYAHSRERPIIHMDIKPENILLTRDYVPKLTDFNISRIIGTVSRTSAAKGYTQGYAAPEQMGIPGYPPPGPYTDVFGLATVIYELITGVKPYPIEVYQNNFRTPYKPKPPSQLNPETPRELDEILEIALQTSPDDRYPNAAQLLKDLWDTYQQYYYG